MHPTIRSTLKQNTCVRTFIFKFGRHLRFNHVHAIQSSCIDRALGLARSGIVSSSTSRQFDKLHAEGVAQDILRFLKTNSKALRCDPLRLHPHTQIALPAHTAHHTLILRSIPHTTAAPGVIRSGAHLCRWGGAETPARRLRWRGERRWLVVALGPASGGRNRQGSCPVGSP